MKPEIKEQWMNALRSGEYSQTRGFLRTSDGFCCLGVLCDLYSKETGTKWGEYQGKFTNSSFIGEFATLPTEVVEWSGIGEQNPYVCLNFSEGHYLILSAMNDSGVEFPEIADTIQKYF